MRLIITIFIINFIVFFSGCFTYNLYYDIGLYKVEKPAETKERYGESKISKLKEKGVEKYYFEDEMLKIIWFPTPSGISFFLTNKTDHTIKIIWDEAAYVDENGISHRVIHAGIKYIDINSFQTPTVVVRKSSLEDLIFPAENIYYLSGEHGGWREEPLFPENVPDYMLNEEFKNRYIGKTIQVLLPIQIEDVINDYIFIFKINNISIEGKDPYIPFE